MKKWTILAVALGAITGAVVVTWLVNDRRIPALYKSAPVSFNSDPTAHWIRLK